MKTYLRTLWVILSLTAVMGCSHSQAQKTLYDVASFIEARPDSALAVLRAMPVPSHQALKAKHALLYSMALDKCYIDTTDIGVVMPAVEYYDNHGSRESKMKSLFYLGRVQANAGDYQGAMKSQIKAKSYADEIGDPYWRAMLASALGYTYNLNMCVSGEVECMEEALELWKEQGDSSHVSIAMYNLAMAYHNNQSLMPRFQRLKEWVTNIKKWNSITTIPSIISNI